MAPYGCAHVEADRSEVLTRRGWRRRRVMSDLICRAATPRSPRPRRAARGRARRAVGEAKPNGSGHGGRAGGGPEVLSLRNDRPAGYVTYRVILNTSRVTRVVRGETNPGARVLTTEPTFGYTITYTLSNDMMGSEQKVSIYCQLSIASTLMNSCCMRAASRAPHATYCTTHSRQ